MRLRRVDPASPGLGRRRCGRGFTYLNERGQAITDKVTIRRVRDLVIPPAWRDVWICPDERGHIQAVGFDEAGRRQYLYHPLWRVRRDRLKFDHVVKVARRLPRLRARVARDLAGRGLSRDRVLAAVGRLLDLGMFRVGGDQYAVGDEPSFGLATLRPEHVRSGRRCLVIDFPAKGGVQQVRQIEDPEVCRVLRQLRRRRPDAHRLFAYWADRKWHDVHAEDVNSYLREGSGTDMTAKDFRTWHATLLAARRLTTAKRQRAASARKRVVAAVMREAAELLGNTPTIARSSYVDPRIVDKYEDGSLVPIPEQASVARAEQAVLSMLS